MSRGGALGGSRHVPIVVLAAGDPPPEQPAAPALAHGWLLKPCDFGVLSIWRDRLLGSPLRHFV